MRAFQVYKAGDVVEQVLNPILDYWSDVKEKYKDSEEIIVGVPLVPSDLPAITPVNLQTYFRFLYKGIIINHNKNRANLH